VELVEGDLKQQLENNLEAHAQSLFNLLSKEQESNKEDQSEGANKNKNGKDSKKRKARPSEGDKAAVTILDASLNDAFSSKNISLIAGAVSSRDPPSEEGIGSLIEVKVQNADDGLGNVLERAVAYLDVGSSLGGLCARPVDKLASFAAFAHYLNDLMNAGIDDSVELNGVSGVSSVLKVTQMALSRLSICCQCIGADSPRDVWTAWSDSTRKSSLPTYLKSSSVCYLTLLAHVKACVLQNAPIITEEYVRKMAESVKYFVDTLSPYASIGIVSSFVDTQIEHVEQLVLFLACSKESLSMEQVDLKTPAYLLYMNTARHAISYSIQRGYTSLAASMTESMSHVMPPVSVSSWLSSQPPSAIIQVLQEQGDSGLSNISQYLIHSIKDKEMRALASISCSQLMGDYGETHKEENASAVDDLLFFESTEGDDQQLNMLPQGIWDEEEDEEDAEMEEDSDQAEC
jgi:hypothetical protein